MAGALACHHALRDVHGIRNRCTHIGGLCIEGQRQVYVIVLEGTVPVGETSCREIEYAFERYHAVQQACAFLELDRGLGYREVADHLDLGPVGNLDRLVRIHREADSTRREVHVAQRYTEMRVGTGCTVEELNSPVCPACIGGQRRGESLSGCLANEFPYIGISTIEMLRRSAEL